MILRTSWEVNQNGLGCIASERLTLHPSWKGLSGKAKVKTGIGKSDLPGLQGGPRKRDLCQLLPGARASALSRLAPAIFFASSTSSALRLLDV
jgi:hypothetical protein